MCVCVILQTLLDSVHGMNLYVRSIYELQYFLERVLTSEGVSNLSAAVNEVKNSYDDLFQDVRKKRLELIHVFHLTELDVRINTVQFSEHHF